MRTTGPVAVAPDALARAERLHGDGDLDGALALLDARAVASLSASRRAAARLLAVRVAFDAAVDDDPSTQAAASRALRALTAEARHVAERAFADGMAVALAAMAGKLRAAATAAKALPATTRAAPLGTRALWTAIVAAAARPGDTTVAAALDEVRAEPRAEPRYLAARVLGAARHLHGGDDALGAGHRDALVEAIDALERELGPAHPRVAWLVNDLAHAPGAPVDALSAWLRRCGRGLTGEDPRWITVHHAAAIATAGAARLEHLAEAVRRARRVATTSAPRLTTLLGALRHEARVAGDAALVLEAAREVEALARAEAAGRFTPAWADALDGVVEALRDVGAWDDAEYAVREVVRVRALGAPAWHRDLDASLGDLHHRHAQRLAGEARRLRLGLAAEHLDRAAARAVAERGDAGASYALARARMVREDLERS